MMLVDELGRRGVATILVGHHAPQQVACRLEAQPTTFVVHDNIDLVSNKSRMGRTLMHVLRSFLPGLMAVALFDVPPASAQQPVKIRVSWVAPVSNWASVLLEKKELAKHLGKSYTMEPVRYAGTPPMVTAVANGELEVANLAYSTLGIAIKNAGIDDLRVIAHEFRDGVPGHYSQEYLVLADGPIKSAQDLKGKVVASNAAGSAVDVAMRAMLRKNGLEDKRDYTVLETPFPTMRAMLAEKKVDLVPGVGGDQQVGRRAVGEAEMELAEEDVLDPDLIHALPERDTPCRTRP
jgi:ABC-type nitrate/sulfonate/bicarbonate transport system substrate-binding protein